MCQGSYYILQIPSQDTLLLPLLLKKLRDRLEMWTVLSMLWYPLYLLLPILCLPTNSSSSRLNLPESDPVLSRRLAKADVSTQATTPVLGIGELNTNSLLLMEYYCMVHVLLCLLQCRKLLSRKSMLDISGSRSVFNEQQIQCGGRE